MRGLDLELSGLIKKTLEVKMNTGLGSGFGD